MTDTIEVLLVGPDGVSINSELSPKASEALKDCTRSGDAEPAIRYVLDSFNVVFKGVGDETGEALGRVKQGICESIYFDSETDFYNPDNCDLYLIWEVASREFD